MSYSVRFTKPKLPPIIRFIVVILAIVACFGWLTYKKSELNKKYENWVPVEAVVTRVDPPEKENGNIVVHYSYRYYIDIPGSDYYNGDDVAEGDEIWVYYNPDDYTESIIEKPSLTPDAYYPFFVVPMVVAMFLNATDGRTVTLRPKHRFHR